MTCIQDVMCLAWADSTHESYGSGLLVFHVYCDSRSIPELDRAPASSVLISAFITFAAGSYSGKTIANYVYGVRAWHILHGVKWSLDDVQIDNLLKAAENMTPSNLKRKKRRPYTIDFICSLRQQIVTVKLSPLSFSLSPWTYGRVALYLYSLGSSLISDSPRLIR
jgi:hypothetical protein